MGYFFDKGFCLYVTNVPGGQVETNLEHLNVLLHTYEQIQRFNTEVEIFLNKGMVATERRIEGLVL